MFRPRARPNRDAAHPQEGDCTIAVKNGSTTRDNSVPITAADVKRSRNPDALKASNPLFDDDIGQTLHRVACVVAFLS